MLTADSDNCGHAHISLINFHINNILLKSQQLSRKASKQRPGEAKAELGRFEQTGNVADSESAI